MSSANQIGDTVSKSEETYASAVLQSLSILNIFKFDFMFYEPKSKENNNTKLTESFQTFLNSNFNSINDCLFQNLIKIYKEYAQNISDALLSDPYHFLKYFLIFLNGENNYVKDISFFQIYDQQKRNACNDFDSCFNLFKNYCKNTQDSIISKNIFYSEIVNITCNYCGSKLFDCSLNPILEIDIQRYIDQKSPELSESKITLKDCLNYYINANPTTCPKCQNNANMFKLLINDSKVLIFYLKRSSHNGFNDINFDIDLDISNCFNKDKTKIKIYTKYTLRACICFSGSIYGYFVDYCIKRKNGNIWYRFNNQNRQINNTELYNYEPIILIYETIEKNKSHLGGNNSNQINQPNNINQMNNMIQVSANNSMNSVHLMNQMKMAQMNQMNNQMNYQMNNQMNQMKQMNQINQMKIMQMNQMKMAQKNTLVRMNTMNQTFNRMNVMNQINQMNPINTMNNQMLMARMAQFAQMNQQNNNQVIFNQGSSGLSTNQNSSASNIEDNNITVDFKIVAENDLQNVKFQLSMQLQSDEVFKDIIKKLLINLDKTENYIKKYLFNDTEILKTSTQKASEINLINKSVVLAILNESEANNTDNNANNNNDDNSNNNNGNADNTNDNNNNNNANANNAG